MISSPADNECPPDAHMWTSFTNISSSSLASSLISCSCPCFIYPHPVGLYLLLADLIPSCNLANHIRILSLSICCRKWCNFRSPLYDTFLFTFSTRATSWTIRVQRHWMHTHFIVSSLIVIVTCQGTQIHCSVTGFRVRGLQ